MGGTGIGWTSYMQTQAQTLVNWLLFSMSISRQMAIVESLCCNALVKMITDGFLKYLSFLLSYQGHNWV